MRRREFITLIGSAAAAWPLAARAQQPAMPVVGLLRAGQMDEKGLTALRTGLSELGYVEGRNVAIELHATEQYDRLPALASELVRRQVAVIFASTLPAAFAAKAATATIPIVFSIGGDPIEAGLVTSMSQPPGNLTGVTIFLGELLPKRLELLRELVPSATLIGVLLNPNNPNSEARSRDVQEAARTIGQRILLVQAGNERDFVSAFSTLVQRRAGALVVIDDPLLQFHGDQIVALAGHHALSRDLLLPLGHRERRSDELWKQHYRCISSGRRLRRAVSSRGVSRRTCRSCRRISSSWSSTTRPQGRSVSPCRRRCSRAPTR